MEILIPGALPPAPIAPELIQYVESNCPELVARFNFLHPQVLSLHPDQTGCTPFEAIELQRKGFQVQNQSNLGAGLGPLRAGVQRADEQVWIAELTSVAIATEGPSLLEPEALFLTQHESDALYDSVAHLWADRPISVLPLNAARWRIWLPNQPVIQSASPKAIAGMALADWWPQHESLREWRKLLNEIQMVWHDHPVNEARAAQGLPLVNSLWLYGGAQGWKPESANDIVIFEDLLPSHTRSDWGTWINTLPALSAFIAEKPQDAILTLLGQQHGIKLAPASRSWWRDLWPAKKHNWKSWWNLQN